MTLGDHLRRLYWWLEPRLAPGVRFAQEVFEESLFACVEPGCEWLDVGCGHTLLPDWRAAAERVLVTSPRRLVGVDPDFSSLRRHHTIRLLACGDGASLPFADGRFDLVTANMVVEHLPEPEKQFREIARVLRPGGRFLFHTPNGTGYPTLLARAVPDAVRGAGARVLEGRGDGDRFRTYYRANTPARIETIARRTGLAVERIELIRSNAMLAQITPLAAVELLLLRALGTAQLRWLRPNLIGVLRRVQ